MKALVSSKEVETEAPTPSQLTNEFSLPAQGAAVTANNRMVPRVEQTNYALSKDISIVIIKVACGE